MAAGSRSYNTGNNIISNPFEKGAETILCIKKPGSYYDDIGFLWGGYLCLATVYEWMLTLPDKTTKGYPVNQYESNNA